MRTLNFRSTCDSVALKTPRLEPLEPRSLLTVGSPTGFGAGTTGGAGGPTVTVTTAADFIAYATKAGPYTIQVQGSLNVGGVHITSDKTITGDGNDTLTGDLGLYGVHNVILQNLFLTNPAGTGEGDAVTIKDGTKNVWVDHVSAFDTTDGLIDVTNGSDNVTLSWNKFYYTGSGSHHFTVLIGSSDDRTSDRGTLHVTLHHNWWSTGAVERMPSVRYGRVHVYDNYYNAPGNNYAIRSRIEAEVLIQNNAFENVKDPYYVYVAKTGETIGKIKASGNSFTNTTGKIDDGNDSVFTPSYSYTLDPPSSVKSLVMNGAGSHTLTSTPVGGKLSGTAIGTAGSYANAGNTIAKALDGKLTTFFDAPSANGAFVGLDLGKAYDLTSIAYASRSGFASRMNGGVFQASNSAIFYSGVATLYTVGAAENPSATSLTTRSVNAKGYRYVRYLAPNGSYGNIAEAQFFGVASATKLAGTTIGTTGSYANAGNTIAKATDGSLATFFDGPTANGNWVGLNLGSAKTIRQIAYAPRAGWASRLVGGRVQVSTSANFSTGVSTLLTITAAPATGVLTTITLAAAATARYVRYLSPDGSYGNIAEFQVFG